MSNVGTKKIGNLLRDWRERRRLSQLDLAYDTEISQKHLSFIELGRSLPSREMILRLSEQLEIPLRERNVLLAAGGFASVFPERSLDDESLSPARKVVDLILERLEPNPSFAVDRHWTLVTANNATEIFTDEVAPELMAGKGNMLRICLHPNGFTPRVINYKQWQKNVLEYLHKQVQATADDFLIELYDELKSYPQPKSLINTSSEKEIDYSGFAIPLRLMSNEGEFSFISTMTVFGTPIDVTVSELAIETFFPADEKTAEALQRRRK
jgi:transcriptional regulator with XRE-family HTH domain